MGRRRTIDKGTLNLTAPSYAALSEAIDDFQNEERLFYKRRAEELSEYPGIGDKTKAQVEKDYDDLLGDDPWDYLDEFNRANNDESEETDDTTNSYGGDLDRFYIKLPDKLAEREDNPDLTSGYGDSQEKYIRYNPGTGYDKVDLLYKDIDFFDKKGSSSSINIGREAGTTYTYYQGFGEVPSKYQSNNKMKGRIAHMKRLIGTLWNEQVKPYWDDYEDALDDYNDYVGGGIDTDIYGENVPDEDRPWDGETNDFKGYNRIEELKSKVIREARGYN